MTEQRDPKPTSLEERLRQFVEGVLEALDELVNPQPQLVPIPIRNGRPRRRR